MAKNSKGFPPAYESFVTPLGMPQITDSKNRAQLYALAAKILKDQLAINELSDRVYELFTSEIHSRSERSQVYRGRI
jgi:hypothetical protein